jgi:hypothetical protein
MKKHVPASPIPETTIQPYVLALTMDQGKTRVHPVGFGSRLNKVQRRQVNIEVKMPGNLN